MIHQPRDHDLTGFERADRFFQGLQELQEEARQDSVREWFDVSEVALRACMKDEGYMRTRRVINKVLGVIGINRSDTPTKAPYLTYGGGEAYGAVRILEEAGLIFCSYDYDSIRLVPEEAPSDFPDPTEPMVDKSGPHMM